MKTFQPAIIVLLTMVALACPAQQRKINREMAHLPPAVRQAIRAKTGDAKLENIEKTTEDGEVSYDVEIVRDGQSRSFTVDNSGAILNEEVFLPELSPAVQRTIQAHSANATVDEIDKSVEDGETSYDVAIVRNGISRGFTVGASGELLDEQVLLNELPPAVRQTITKEAGAATVDEIDKSIEDGEITYDVDLTDAGKPRDLSVDGKGTLIDKLVFLSELPEPVRAAIEKQGSLDGEIHESIDDGEISYDIEATGDRTLSFGPTGGLLSTEQDVRAQDTPEPVQDQIKSLALGGKLLGVTKSVEDGETNYDVDLETAGKTKTVTLGMDGKIIPDDE